jgi:hypothetical protein
VPESVAALAAATLFALGGMGCLGDSGSSGAETGARGSSVSGEGTTTAARPPADVTAEDFDPAIFDPERSFVIDNAWLPMEPGTQYVHRGWTEEDGEKIPHRIVSIVTDLTKGIGGVRAAVGWERDFSDGKLVEAELFFNAQDRGGNVWHLGEYTEEWEDGELVGGQAWLAGHLAGARAGLMMKADPQLRSSAYSEGFAPAPYYWADQGKVFDVGTSTCVPVDCYNDVLVIDEFDQRSPDAHQLKYYARSVGPVRTGWRGSDPDKEVLVLASLRRLTQVEMTEARRQALALETRARVYGLADPAQKRE